MADVKISGMAPAGVIVDSDKGEVSQHNESTPVTRAYTYLQVYTYINGKLNVGNLTATGSAGLSVVNGSNSVINGNTSITQHVADTSNNGYLSSTDWNAFNNKQASGDYLTGLTGDVAALGPGIGNCSITFGAVTDIKVNASANIQLSKINTSNLGKGYGGNLSDNVALTNPCGNYFYLINNTGIITLPRMDNADSLSSTQNSRIVFNNIASGNYTINDFNNDFLLTIPPGKIYEFFPRSNTVNLPGGQWAWIDLSYIYSTTGSPLNVTDGVLSISQANASAAGYLSATDWNTFNSKQAGGNYITALTGDGGATGPGSAVFTLATVNSNVGSFGNASSVASFTVTAKGLVTAANSVSIQIAESQVTNLVSDLAGKQATGSYITALTGDVTASGPGSAASTIANNAITTVKINNGAITDAKLATMAASSLKGNATGSTATPTDIPASFTANRVVYGTGTSFTSSANLGFDGTDLTTGAGGGIKLGNSTASYTPARLDYYETGTFTVNFTGASTMSNVTVSFVRIGNGVFLFFSGVQAAATAASSLTTGSSAIPTRLRPASGKDYDGNCWVMDNSSWITTPGRAIALSDGTIQIYKANVNTNFTNSGNCGFSNIYMRYICS